MVYRMSRTDFEVRCGEDSWKRGDYDARRGLAEVVETPLFGHEWRAAEARESVSRLCAEQVEFTGALRIEWQGSILEPDTSFYFAPNLHSGHGDDEVCRPESGHRPPALVVEINRSSNPARAAEKRRDYFDLGVREVRTWRPGEGASIYRRGDDGYPETAEESAEVPGVTLADLEELRAAARPGERAPRRPVIVRRIRERRPRRGRTSPSR